MIKFKEDITYNYMVTTGDEVKSFGVSRIRAENYYIRLHNESSPDYLIVRDAYKKTDPTHDFYVVDIEGSCLINNTPITLQESIQKIKQRRVGK